MPPDNILPQAQKPKRSPAHSPSRIGRRVDWLVTLFFIIFFVSGLMVATVHDYFGMDQAWAFIIVTVCFSMSCTLILYYFLSSTANIEKPWVKLGGAAAGFLVFFWVLSDRLEEMLSKKMIGSLSIPTDIDRDLRSIISDYEGISQIRNATIKNIAKTSVRNLRQNFVELATGNYTVQGSDLPTYLMPLIDNAKKSYWATQYVLPKTFWEQYWSKTYFEKNVKAVKERNIDLIRVFILDIKESKLQKEVLDDLIEKHVSAGIKILILDTEEYESKYGSEDLADILLVDDELAGILLLDRNGKFSRVQFSIDPSTIEKRKQQFLRLKNFSLDYKTWVVKYHKEWLQ